MQNKMFKKSLILITIALIIAISTFPSTTSYPKTKEENADNINFLSQYQQHGTSTNGGLLVGPYLIAKISVNFSQDVGWVHRSGRLLVFSFGPYGIGCLKLRPLSEWNDPFILYSNATGEPVSHGFWVAANWFFGKIKYSNDRILIDGWCIRIITFVDIWVMTPNATLYPVDDAYVDADQPDQNFGTAETLKITEQNETETARTYVKFNLSSIPNDVKIHFALLQFYYTDSTGWGEPKVGAYQINSSWEENNITWNNQPESSPICEHHILLSQYDPWHTEYWDLTRLVRGWKSGSIPNNGVVIKFCNPCPGDIMQRVFRSKEWNVENEKPTLIISYY
jgi:hypothetical protein